MKILIIYATAGAGHRMAAEALNQGFQGSGYDVHLVDALDHTSRFYKRMYSQSYTFLITHLSWLWGFFFQLIDLPWLQPAVRAWRRLYNHLNGRALERFLVEQDFDYIFSTHFFPNEVMAHLKRRERISATLVCCVTDFDVHRIWLAEGIDHYTVASAWTRDKIVGLGVEPSCVHICGIPTHPKFSVPKDLGAIRAKLALKPDTFTVLVATGSFGIGPIAEILQKLSQFQVLVVCGHNRALFESLSRRNKGLAKIYGLVNNMEELMAVADLMITKPGGLSISEALVTGLPMVFFNAIPGQETNNIKVLKTYGVGISGCSVDAMAAIIMKLKGSPAELKDAKERSRSLGRPAAVAEITALAR